jgi:hypothetical protein
VIKGRHSRAEWRVGLADLAPFAFQICVPSRPSIGFPGGRTGPGRSVFHADADILHDHPDWQLHPAGAAQGIPFDSYEILDDKLMRSRRAASRNALALAWSHLPRAGTW